MTDSRFAKIPIDEDTQVIASRASMFGDWPMLHQTWTWDNTQAESLIFLADDVAHLDDEALQRTVRESTLVKLDGRITVARERDGYTFVNFNFEY